MNHKENEEARKAFETFLSVSGLKKFELAEHMNMSYSALTCMLRKLSSENIYDAIIETMKCTIGKYGLFLDEEKLEAWQSVLQQFADNILKQAGFPTGEDEEEE